MADALVTVDEVKDHLNITRPIAAGNGDSELQLTIDASHELVDLICGPSLPTVITERINGAMGGRRSLVLDVRPVLSVQTVNGVAVPLAVVYGDAGIITGITASDGSTIVYTAGRSPIPAALKKAELELIRHAWLTQRGPENTGMPANINADDVVVIGSGYTIPARAWEYMERFALPGFA